MILNVKPSERQLEFMQAEEKFVAYGGARGGGKSWAVQATAIKLAFLYHGIKILILRRHFRELKENHMIPMQKLLLNIAVFKETDKCFTFPNTSRIIFGYCDNFADTLQYQGQEFDIIFIDEATQIMEEQFKTLSACVRGANNFPKRMYLTCNPGGVGHAWVKRLFIDRDFLDNEDPSEYRFIPARVTDNKILMEKNPEYIKMLEGLPEGQRRAWLEGDWNALAGQYFSEFRTDRHVIKPFNIPPDYRRFFVMDYGLDKLAGYWAAFDTRGCCYIYREIYESNLIVSAAAAKILSLGMFDGVESYFAPSDIWGTNAETGNSQADIFNLNGIPLTKVITSSRENGWAILHEWLNNDRIKIFDTCTNLIRCFPQVLHDERNVNDVAKEPHELTHSLDAIRYLACAKSDFSKPVEKEVFKPRMIMKGSAYKW